MSRETKFRAWLKKEKKMVEVKTLHLGTRKIIYGYSENSQCYGNKSCSFDDVRLMQYIGIKDKNNKKVYEGDFVRSYDYENKECINWVEFNEKCQSFVVSNEKCYYPLLDSSDRIYDCADVNEEFNDNICDFEYQTNDYEVIGNIYDNPELLEVE